MQNAGRENRALSMSGGPLRYSRHAVIAAEAGSRLIDTIQPACRRPAEMKRILTHQYRALLRSIGANQGFFRVFPVFEDKASPNNYQRRRARRGP